MLPTTVERVSRNTRDQWNERIRRQTEENITEYSRRGGTAIERRLAELDAEWDIERTLEANAATAVLVGVTLSTLDRRFLILPAAVAGFLLQHALQGWCPPLGLFRRLGVRTATEIEQERMALKALRGDFREIENRSGQSADPSKLLAAAQQ